MFSESWSYGVFVSCMNNQKSIALTKSILTRGYDRGLLHLIEEHEKMFTQRKKSKLRTASEVLSRLRWSTNDGPVILSLEHTVIGYKCRLNGPMEKCAADFNSINEGGDIPEHRIQYFRIENNTLEKGVLWDRVGRVDRVFGSGNGHDSPVSSQTLEDIETSIITMKRLREEKVTRAKEKAKLRARHQLKKADCMNNLNLSMTNKSSNNDHSFGLVRHTWETQNSYHSFHMAQSRWIISAAREVERLDHIELNDQIKFITWNVLFDLERDDNNNFVQGDSSLLDSEDTTNKRWETLLDIIHAEDASIIALQEVTPRFLDLLQCQRWVQKNYTLSSGVNDLDPYGNLILWKRELFSFAASYICRDLNRCRAIVVSLNLNNRTIINVADVHLPADSHDHVKGKINDRTIARQRELASIVAKLQYLEQEQINTKSVAFIMGDFNSDENLLPNDHFHDSWESSSVKDTGLTYNWKTNKRTQLVKSMGFSTKSPRRIDRIYGSHEYEKASYSETKLLGDGDDKYPPSDHYGVSTTVKFNIVGLPTRSQLYDRKQVCRNAWSMCAIPTNDTLLALLIDDYSCNGVELYNKSSSLPIAHVSLLNGFVDLSSGEQKLLAISAVQDAVRQIFDSNQLFTLELEKTSLELFEHANSVSLVCCPRVDSNGGKWLSNLYKTLRAKFVHCDNQERRFITGWTPHLTMGKFSNEIEAREAMMLIQSKMFKCNDNLSINAYGVGLYRRGAMDGKFHIVHSVPLLHNRPRYSLLDDSGISASTHMRRYSSIVLKEIELACDHVAKCLGSNRIKQSLQCYGSHAHDIAIPRISDIDVIVKLIPTEPNKTLYLKEIDCKFFLQEVGRTILRYHNNAKLRIRISKTETASLHILTVKMASEYPSLDLMVCKLNQEESPIDDKSTHVYKALEDSEVILSSFMTLQSIHPKAGQSVRGALRIIKMWAHQRGIYGTQLGFLSGGAWTVLLIYVLNKIEREELLPLLEVDSIAISSKKIVSCFFKHVLQLWSIDGYVAKIDTKDGDVIPNYQSQKCGRMTVIAPASGGNFGRSSTESTTLCTYFELERMLLKVKSREEINDIFQTAQIFGDSMISLKIDLSPDSQSKSPFLKPAEIKAWAASKMLSLIVALETIIPSKTIRLFSTIFRENNCFIFYVGIAGKSDKFKLQLEDFTRTHSIMMEQEQQYVIPNIKLSLSCTSST